MTVYPDYLPVPEIQSFNDIDDIIEDLDKSKDYTEQINAYKQILKNHFISLKNDYNNRAEVMVYYELIQKTRIWSRGTFDELLDIINSINSFSIENLSLIHI